MLTLRYSKQESTDKKREMKKLSRVELLEMLLDLSRENDVLKAENEELKRKLDEKQIILSESGSIAEAAMKLSGVFTAAQEAADRYLLSVQRKGRGEDDA